MKLVARLYIIDRALTGENAMLVSEYNQIVEEIWNLVAPKEQTEEKGHAKVLRRENNDNI